MTFVKSPKTPLIYRKALAEEKQSQTNSTSFPNVQLPLKASVTHQELQPEKSEKEAGGRAGGGWVGGKGGMQGRRGMTEVCEHTKRNSLKRVPSEYSLLHKGERAEN